MRRKKNRFMDILEAYVTEYMPYAAGLSDNTMSGLTKIHSGCCWLIFRRKRA